MTRNNLGDHLSWLLSNVAISRPAGISFPTVRDPPVLGLSHSQIDGGSLGSQGGVSTHQAARSLVSIGPDTISSGNGLSTSEDQFQDEEEIIRAEEGMARLTSASKSTKPSLVVKQQHPLTPSSITTTGGRFEQAYRTILQPKDAQNGRSSISDVYLSSARRQRLPVGRPTPDLLGSDDEDSHVMDLTGNEAIMSSDSAHLGEPVTKRREDYDARRPDPLASHGKKRKSEEIAKVEDSEPDEFPDIYKILGTSAPPSSRSVKSSKAFTPSSRRTAADSAIIEERTVTQTISRTERRLRRTSDSEGSGSPIRRAIFPANHEPGGQTPTQSRLSSPTRESSKRPKLSKMRATELLADSTGGKLEQTKKGRKVKIIQDSEDEYDEEFLTPPTHHTPRPMPDSLTRAKPYESSQSITTDEIIMAMDTPSRLAPKARLEDSNSVTTSRQPVSVPVDEPKRSHEPPKGSMSEHFTSSRDTGTSPLAVLLKNPRVVEAKLEVLEQQIRQNRRNFLGAVEADLPREERQKIQNAKEPLVKQKAAIMELSGLMTSHQSLIREKITLAQKIAQAYEEDLDADAERYANDRDEISVQLKVLEQSLSRSLCDSGMDDVNLLEELAQASDSGGYSGSVISGTQPSRSAERTVSRQNRLPAERGSQVVRQTQFPPGSRLSELREPSPPPFARSSLPSKTNAKTHIPQIIPRQLEHTDDDGGFFSESEEEMFRSTHNPAPTRPNALPLRKSPPKLQHGRGQDCFSDFSDDAEMLAVAQDVELRQSSSEDASRNRSVLSQTSGNAGPHLKAKNTLKKREPATAKYTIPPELMKHPWSPEVKKALKDRFRMKGFRPNQLEAINATLSGRDAFVLMPTGGGKSLCYQLPAVLNSGKTKGVTIVVSPLISLMHDQVDHLKALNISAISFNSEANAQYRNQVMSALKERNPEHYVQLLYVTPEMINKSQAFLNGLQDLYRNKRLARIVIDEAHCVSQWGHDFRPDYKALGSVRHRFPGVPVIALTATATLNVIVDVKHHLGMDTCQVFSQSFNRPNLYYEVRRKEKSLVESIANLITTKYDNQTGIIYTLSRKTAEQVAEKLKTKFGIKAHHYHASVAAEDKTWIQRQWQKGAIKVVVATIAFGMGIDKPDVRFVIHHALPKSLEGYYQETGRAGRDGNPSDCILYFGYGDVTTLRKLIAEGEGSNEQKERQRVMLNKVAAFCDDQDSCRRVAILRYFGETFSSADCNKTCDNCRAGAVFEQQDLTRYAVAVLEVVDAQERLTINQCADILMGKKYPPNEEQLSGSNHGIASSLKKYEVQRIIDKLAAEDALGEENRVNRKFGIAIQYLTLGRNAHSFLSGRRKLFLSVQVSDRNRDPSAPKSRKRAKKDDDNDEDDVELGTSVLPPSTNVSSPMRQRAQKGKRKSLPTVIDSDDEEEDDNPRGLAVHKNGFLKDGFVVSDKEDSDDGFEPLQKSRQRKTAARKVGPPISKDKRLEDLNDIHQDITLAFMQEAKSLEEKVRNEQSLRRPLFSEKDFREMAINWTTTLKEMRWITGIDTEKVDKFGGKFIPLIKRFHTEYKAIMPEEDDASDPPNDVADHDVVDLISSDIEGDETESDDDGVAEASKYFTSGAASPRAAASTGVQEWHARLEQANSEQPSRAPSTRGRGGSARGGKKASYRKASGGNSHWRNKGSGGVTKRKASGGSSRRTSGAAAAPSRSTASFFSKGGRGGKKDGGGSKSGSGIALMDY